MKRIELFRQFECQAIFPNIEYVVENEEFVKINTLLKKDCLNLINKLVELNQFSKIEQLNINFVLVKSCNNMVSIKFNINKTNILISLPYNYFQNIAESFENETIEKTIDSIINIIEESLNYYENYILWLNEDIDIKEELKT